MRVSQFVILLILGYFATGVMSKKVAGLAVFRRVNDTIEYLMLKPNNSKKEWSPPKGNFSIFFKFRLYFDLHNKLKLKYNCTLITI